MKRYVIESWIWLVYFDCLMRFRGFEQLHSAVRDQKIVAQRNRVDDEHLTRSVDLASVLYFKPVLCLQRSAANALLLRRYGWAADLVIGIQLLPFRSHAWVEVEGRVVNDKPYVTETFEVLERW